MAETANIYADYIYVSENKFNHFLENAAFAELQKRINKLLNEIDKIYQKNDVIYFVDADAAFHKPAQLLVPVWNKYNSQCSSNGYYVNDWQPNLPQMLQGKNLQQRLPTTNEFITIDKYVAQHSWKYCSFRCSNNFINLSYLNTYSGESGYKIAFPVIQVPDLENNTPSFFANLVLKYELTPETLSDNGKNLLELARFLGSKHLGQSDNKIIIQNVKPEEIINSSLSEKDHLLSFPEIKHIIESRTIEEYQNDFDEVDELLNCDKKRANIEPYKMSLLNDANRGHWDLWPKEQDKLYKVRLKTQLVARNPCTSYQNDGVIAIDFGTKSTVVAFQNGSDYKELMRIGNIDSGKQPDDETYENPTIMNLVDLNKFLTAYRASSGRPFTEWDDLPVSYAALDKFSKSASKDYYSFLYQIKQWAGEGNKPQTIKSMLNDNLLTLPPYLELKEDDFDPIEIYAYYIGLYINNMNNGIFLRYYLSLPVTYKPEIQTRLAASFKKGLRKSLPALVLDDLQKRGKDISVTANIKEPEAYAACALQEYGFEPEDDEHMFYGIFDFGGGTTDFNFGLWSKSWDDNYDYRLEHIFSDGDRYLGGETLLEQLAYEIFKENIEIMRSNNYPFKLPPTYHKFPGSEGLALESSQEAERNTHNLMENLRQFWEITENKNSSFALYDDIDQQSFEKYLRELLPDLDQAVAAMFEGAFVALLDSFIQHDAGSGYATTLRNAIISLLAGIYDSLGTEMPKEIMEKILAEGSGSQANGKVILKTALFNGNSERRDAVPLETTLETINKFINKRITAGVQAFFESFLQAASSLEHKPEKLYIFLAGNSCKSPVVRKAFDAVIPDYKKSLGEKDIEFDIYPPLGTEEAYKKMRDKGAHFDTSERFKPTGKTGVAFGLLDCCEGSCIEVIRRERGDNDAPFKFYIGRKKNRRFEVFKGGEKPMPQAGHPEYHEWYRFSGVTSPSFFIYYSDSAACVQGGLASDDKSVKRKMCELEDYDSGKYANASIYIRAIAPDTLEYVAASDDDVDNSMIGQPFECVLE